MVSDHQLGFIPGEDQVTLSAAIVVWPQTCNAPFSVPDDLSGETLALVSFTHGVPGTWNRRQNAYLPVRNPMLMSSYVACTENVSVSLANGTVSLTPTHPQSVVSEKT